MTDWNQIALNLVDDDDDELTAERLVEWLRTQVQAEALAAADELERLRELADHYSNLLFRLNIEFRDLSIAYGRLKYAAEIATGREDPAPGSDRMTDLDAWVAEYSK